VFSDRCLTSFWFVHILAHLCAVWQTNNLRRHLPVVGHLHSVWRCHLLPTVSKKPCLSSRLWQTQVDGCGRNLAKEKEYYRRYRVCKSHAGAQEVRCCTSCRHFL
jgi:SBP domain